MANSYIQLLMMNEYQNLKLVGVSNWDGLAFIGKRWHVSLLSKIEQLKNPGVYFLLGENDENGRKILYIGESENVASRLQYHASDKNKAWFEDFIVFTSKKGDLNKAHVKYLEADFIELAQEILTTIDLQNECNSNSKKDNKLQTFDLAKAEGFKEQIIFVLNNLNLINFVDREADDKNRKKDIFYMNLKRDNKSKQAKLEVLDNGYRLLKGSYLERDITASFPVHNQKKRAELIEKGLIVEKDSVYRTVQDIYFKSPSGAGAFVLGRSCNGRAAWCLADGTCIDEYELMRKSEDKSTSSKEQAKLSESFSAD